MSSPLQQVVIAVVTAGVVSFASVTFYAGSADRQIKINTDELKRRGELVAKFQVMESNMAAMEKRLDTYENLVIDGQKEILKEIAAMNVQAAKSATKIGAIEIDISEIKESMR